MNRSNGPHPVAKAIPQRFECLTIWCSRAMNVCTASSDELPPWRFIIKFRVVWVGSSGDLPMPPESALEPCSRGVRYERRGPEMVRVEQKKVIPVANFYARIVRDVTSQSEGRYFGIAADLQGEAVELLVPAAEFSKMNWVATQLGPRALLYPGQQQHARAAIQYLSTEIRREQIFSHLGWVNTGKDWFYLHSDGLITSAGNMPDCRVRLPAHLTVIPTLPGS